MSRPAYARDPGPRAPPDGLRRRRATAPSPSTCRSGDEVARLRAAATRAARRSCSRGRPDAARPASSSTWRGGSGGRWSRSPATTTSRRATSPGATSSAAARRCGRTGRSRAPCAIGAICYLDEVVEARQDTVVVHPSAHRRPPHAADREDRRAGRGRARLSARDLLQPRLPARAQGPEAEHPAALRGAGVRLPAGRARDARSSRTRAASTSATARALVELGGRVRRLRDRGLAEVPSTRLLVATARLIARRHRAGAGLPGRPHGRRSPTTPTCSRPSAT